MGNHIGNFDVITVEDNGKRSEVEVAVVDERRIFRRFAIELRRFGKFGFFAYGRICRWMGGARGPLLATA